MRPTSKAQSTIELLFMGILVMTGIVVIGPYVLDAVKGNFKLWDSTSQEALNDRLVQARPDQIDLTAGACTCVRSPGSCHTQGCKVTERAFRKNCTPVGCESEFECKADDLCCNDPVRTTACYRSTYNPDPGKQWASYIPNELIAQGFHVNAAPNPPCNIGDRVYEFQCGAKSGQLLCKYDNQVSSVDGDKDCRPACTPPVTPGAPYSLCPDDDKGLADDTNLKIVAYGKCTAATKCEAECGVGQIPTPDGMTCGLDNTTYSGTGCTECPFGRSYIGTGDYSLDYFACNLNGLWGSFSYGEIIPPPNNKTRYSQITVFYGNQENLGAWCGIGFKVIDQIFGSFSWKMTSNPPSQSCDAFVCSNW